MCDQLARDGVFAKDLQKISFSFHRHSHLGGSSWHFASQNIRERDHTPRTYPRYRFWQSCISFLGSWWQRRRCHLSNALRHFGGVNLPERRTRSRSQGMTEHAGDTPQGDCRGRGPPASFKQGEISLPAQEICLGEDHRIKTKTFKPRKELF